MKNIEKLWTKLWDMTNDENMGMSLSHAHVIKFCLISRLHPWKRTQNLNMDLYYKEGSAFANHGFQPIFLPIAVIRFRANVWNVCHQKGNCLMIIIIAAIIITELLVLSFLLSSLLAFFPWLLRYIRILTWLNFSSWNVCTSWGWNSNLGSRVASFKLQRLRWSSSEVATWFMAISPAATAVWMMPTWHVWWKLG